MEEPGFAPPCEVLERHGCRLVPVPVDGEGLIVEAGRQRAPGARMALVTPSHQAPLGVSMSLARRAELLGWATQAGAWVVEDDYDGEYHYAGPPLPALKSLDAHDRVIYTGSFSKVLYPGLALAYLVAPAPLVQACGQAPRPGPMVAPSWSRPSSPISWPRGIFPVISRRCASCTIAAGVCWRRRCGRCSATAPRSGWRRAACTSSSGCRNMATTPRRRDAPRRRA
ncbi:PLP-dependent aminotransferase family protein [Achromobacter xylosoxidans]